ncbi:probable LRR receptor-like serine/threonine-protein kinase At3g47570 [Phragmites australis]|uniref:probable LRR receptor-like serine/threonine-protein kinase At3g47570 n=1 Tax=Phragmites australis TaxID=29695 RepID=UPI002D777C39|nr:probable LRR receptor-like serine/threonine-protein kinase At3g47570 [Phragmites australis]XP_062182614.1 probable LRR receptor-like serine/threonine-protein kinase At3g47570 [Phragmites australis]
MTASAMVGQLLLVLMASSAQLIICSSLYGNETDRLSLLEFKKAISLDPQQVLLSWNDSTHFCNWEGVMCRRKIPRRVTSLDLGNRGLVGHISPSLGNLTFLKHLFLATNIFSGKIPPSLGRLRRIRYLYLSNNTFQGEIPDFANCSNLNMLWLDGNRLVGQLPTYANLPPRLHDFQIFKNNLTGTIPPSMSNITTLTRLNIAFNQINGEIPSEIGMLPMLQLFDSAGNKLSGRFQPAILNLSSLVKLSLASNYLNGELPSNLGSSLPNLQFFYLGDNHFNWHIPSSLTNATKLFAVDMSSNNFTGVVPSSIGKLKELTWLNLENNQFQAHDKQDWDFMYSLNNCTELRALSLYGNQLEGEIPSSFGNFSTGNQLQELYIGSNRISGDFPTGIANHRSLNIISFGENQFTGAIPEWLGTLKNLQELDLSDNLFTGYIPSSLSNLSKLAQLALDYNQLKGKIPPSLGNLKALEILRIFNNNLYGRIPKEIFNIPTIVYISLSFNSLDGPLPLEIGNAKQLHYLFLSSNNLSNTIPDTLGNCESMQGIELDQNYLIGSIPASLGNMRSLEILNMSHNHLSGSIPQSIGSLQYLEQLDLSFNHLDGEVPETGIFQNTTAIRIDGNKGLCGGPAVLHLPACTVTPPSSTTKHMRSIVFKVVIPLASVASLAMVITVVLLLCMKRQKRKFMSLPSFGRNFPKVSYNDLARATNGFSTSNLIGRGRYSYVYRGELFQDGNVVAVKVFSLETRGAQRSFIAECNALRNVRHRNLVPILTACSSIDSEGNDFKALIYEFMPRGDLHKLLYSNGDEENSSGLCHITLAQRLCIVVDVADALEYLHHNNQGTIVHCDLKPSNILLDDNLTAHVGDFGLARFEVDSTTSSFGDSISTYSIAIKGTIGYVAPEYAAGGEVSTAADVYSFGVVLLELLIRRRPTDDMFKEGLSIARFTEMNMPDRVLEIVDPQLQQELDLGQETPAAVKENGVHCLISVLHIGLCCTKSSPNERISMQEVAAKLHGIKDAYLRGNRIS